MVKIIAGSNGKEIAQELSIFLNIEYIDAIVEKFADQEFRIHLPLDLYKQDAIIVQSTSTPANDNLMELLLLIDSARRAGSKRVTAVVPYFGYSRQDSLFYKSEPISANLVAKMLEVAGLNQIITLDLHSKQVEGFFKINVQNVDPTLVFALHTKNLNNIIVVSPDIGGSIRATKIANILKCDVAIINKIRTTHNYCEMNKVIGNVSGKNCLIIDDIIDTGETICKAILLLKQNGALDINVVATHAVLSNNAKEKLINAPINSILTTNSIPQNLTHNKFYVINIARIIANKLISTEII